MADLLSHVLVAYVVLTVAGWRLDWLSREWVVVGMGGAIIPDLQRLDLLVDSTAVEGLLGIPFTYDHLGTLGGLVLVAALVTVAFERRWWGRVYGLLLAGGLSHLLVDGMRVWADGRAGAWLFPVFPGWRPPSPNLYVTANPVIPLLAALVAALVFGADRWLSA